MTIISQQIIGDRAQKDGRRYLRYEFTDHLGGKYIRGPKLVPPSFDADADLLTQVPVQEDDLANIEIQQAINNTTVGLNPDKVPDHQTQPDFDRRVLGRMMLIINSHVFYAAYPMFQAVELRGGANANQRAVYLGITTVDYNLIASRFNNVSGVAWFLNDEKNQIWDKLPEDFN